MKGLSLRMRLLGTMVGAIAFFFIVSVIASRLVLQHDLTALGTTQVTNGGGAFTGYSDSRRDQIKLLVAQDAVRHRRVAILGRPYAVLLLHRPRLVSDTGVRSGR